MNSRIQALANQAEDWAEGQNFYESDYRDYLMEKFAELIIQECMDIALAKKKWVEDQTVFDPRDQAWNQARIQQSQHIVDNIKDHFGVE